MRAREFISRQQLDEMDRRNFLRAMAAAGMVAAAPRVFAGPKDAKTDAEWQRLSSKEMALWKQRQVDLSQRASQIFAGLKGRMDKKDLPYVSRARIMIHTDRSVYSWASVGDDGWIELDLAVFWDLSNDCLAYVIAHEIGHLVINGRIGQKIERYKTHVDRRKEELAADVYGAKLAYSLGYDPRKAFELFSDEVKSLKGELTHPSYDERKSHIYQKTGIPVASVSTPQMIAHNMNAIKTFMQASSTMVG